LKLLFLDEGAELAAALAGHLAERLRLISELKCPDFARIARP